MNNMKKTFFTIIIALLHFATKAQLTEEAIFTHYHVNPALVNPGAYGANGNQVFLNIRSAWTGFPGAPITYAVSGSGRIGNVLTVGGSVMAENIAALTNQRFQGGLGGRFKITDDFTISAGLTGEISQRGVSGGILDNEFYQPGDPIVEGNIDRSRFFDATFGVFAQLGSTYAGVSLPNLVTAKLSDIRLATDTSTNQLSFMSSLTAQLGHEFFINDNLQIEPSLFFLKMENVPLRIDANLLVKFLEEAFTIGVSFRHMQTAFDDGLTAHGAGLLGFKVSTFRIYYAYDVSFMKFQEYNGGGHEVTIGFNFGGQTGSKARIPNF